MIVVSHDVFCEGIHASGGGCGVWVNGSISGGVREAREGAKAQGWTHQHVYGTLRDLCPDCALKWKERP